MCVFRCVYLVGQCAGAFISSVDVCMCVWSVIVHVRCCRRSMCMCVFLVGGCALNFSSVDVHVRFCRRSMCMCVRLLCRKGYAFFVSVDVHERLLVGGYACAL